jgi:hypothetical protein
MAVVVLPVLLLVRETRFGSIVLTFTASRTCGIINRADLS